MLTQSELNVHARALSIAERFRKIEWELIEILQLVEETKFYQRMNCKSLFSYAHDILGLSESAAYMFNTVAKKASHIACLQRSLQEGKISVSKASRIVSTLTPRNAEELVRFAETHKLREIDYEVARLNPRARSRERAKVISEDAVELTITVSKKGYEDLCRIVSLKDCASLADAVEKSTDLFLKTHDPVRKAKLSRGQKTREPLFNRGLDPDAGSGREPLTAEQRHAVFSRDEGRCTYCSSGERCDSDRWVHIHHIVPVSDGGSNDPSNLTTLCSFHHKLVHQLSISLEKDAIYWQRAGSPSPPGSGATRP